jgi:hypothetical protein
MIKYWINLNEGDETLPKQMIEITPGEAIPKSRSAHCNLMKKYGATKTQENAYRIKVGLTPI